MQLRHGAILALLMLCSCSGGPSSSDIKNAIQEFSSKVSGERAPIFEEVTDVE